MNHYIGTSMIVSDLDGTLADSKQSIDSEMADLITSVLHTRWFVVISGGGLEQLRSQVVDNLSATADQLARLILMPTSGSAMYQYRDGEYRAVYQLLLDAAEVMLITKHIEQGVQKFGYPTSSQYGELIEPRGSAVTYSALGQNAPLDIKRDWDSDASKRRVLRDWLEERLPQFQFSIGGSTSIDVTKKGIDKSYGIRALSEYTGVAIPSMLYLGDALFDGGNDAIVKSTGIPYRQVASVADTKQLLRELLA